MTKISEEVGNMEGYDISSFEYVIDSTLPQFPQTVEAEPFIFPEWFGKQGRTWDEDFQKWKYPSSRTKQYATS